MDLFSLLLAVVLTLSSLGQAQQYIGDFINNSLPQVPGAEITYFRIPDPAGKNNNLTLINYYSHGNDGNRIIESKIQRAVIVIHGLNRDPGTYESNALSALYQLYNPDINFDTVAVIAPYFPNGDDKNIGYPWTTGLAAGLGSTTNALVWPGSQWSAGGNAQYPNAQKNTISSHYVLDTLVKYFDNTTLFPNVKQIVVAGHSLGAQTVHRYAAIGNNLNTRSPVTYWVANPNSYVWMNTTRPFDTSTCSVYDVYRDGYTNFTQYPMTYATSLVASGRSAILANFNSKGVAYARGLQDLGDDSSNCAPFTTGGNRNERFFNFIKAFPPSCKKSSNRDCDTIDLINVGHDSGQMMASPAGQARLFIDNFYGNGTRAYDMGYPRQQIGDDPFPDPVLNGTLIVVNNGTYAGNMTYFGCWSDQTPATLPYFAFDNSSNTIEVCTSTCNSLGYSIAGVEYGSQCFCGNTLTYKAQQTVDSSCSLACAGNANETCGGFSRTSIFSKGSPAQYAPPVNLAKVGGYQYSNCYLETPGRALTATATTSDSLTLEMCASFCSGYKYFATEYARECYCGDALQPGANITTSTDCSLTCSGNPSEICGAANRLSVYMVAPAVVNSSTTSATPTPSATPAVCPASNNTIIVSNGANWLVECQMDHYGGDLAYISVNSLQQCIDTCATTKTCVDVSLSSTACYMKSSLGQGNVNIGVDGARFVNYTATTSTLLSSSVLPTSSSTILSSSSSIVLSSSSSVLSTSSSTSSSSTSAFLSSSSTTLSSSTSVVQTSSTVAPTSSSTQKTSTTTTSTSTSVTSSSTSSSIATSSTTSYSTTSSAAAATSSVAVTCPASNNTIISSLNSTSFLIECYIDHYGGDMGLVYVDTFNGCINACANTTGCVDVSLNGQACYMKSALGAANSNSGVWGAKVVIVTSSSSIATPTSSALLSTSSSVVVTSLSTSSSVAITSSFTSSSIAVLSSSTTTSSSMAVTSSSTSSSVIATSSLSSSSVVVTSSSTSSSIATTSSTPLSTSSSTTTSSTSKAITSSVATASSTTSSSLTTSTTTSSAAYSSVSGYAYPTLANGFSYAGCYMDGGARAFSYSNGSSSSMTPQACASTCRSLGYRYSGSEYSSECWCNNYLTSSIAPDTDCANTCSGDSKQNCGGGYRLSVVADSTWVQTLFTRQKYNTWNMMGCYADNSGSRDLPNLVALPGGASNATIANCLTACAASGYKYCGAEYYSECYGSNTAPSASPIAGDPLAAGCTYACNANSTEACGGNAKISIYINNGTSV